MIRFLDLSLASEDLRPDLDAAIARVLDSGCYIGGDEVESFEQDFAAYCGARCCVGVASGLDALILTLKAHEIGDEDEVIVPSNTYIATWLAVSAVGARIVPVEPDPVTSNLDPERVAAAITSRTAAILAVHLYGRAAETAALAEIAGRHGIKLIIDAAQAHGLPGGGWTSAFSFYPTKNLGALGDGGAVITDDPDLAGRVRTLGNYGSRDKYHHEIRGVNSRLDPIQAAILGVKLGRLDAWNHRRREIALTYRSGLEGIPDLTLPPPEEGAECVWHIFPVRHPNRDALAAELAHNGVGTLIHYPVPPHLSPAYRDLGFRAGDFPIAEEIAATELSLPLHPHLTDDQVDDVIASVCLASCLPAGAKT